MEPICNEVCEKNITSAFLNPARYSKCLIFLAHPSRCFVKCKFLRSTQEEDGSSRGKMVYTLPSFKSMIMNGYFLIDNIPLLTKSVSDNYLILHMFTVDRHCKLQLNAHDLQRATHPDKTDLLNKHIIHIQKVFRQKLSLTPCFGFLIPSLLLRIQDFRCTIGIMRFDMQNITIYNI